MLEDPFALIANASLAEPLINWNPKYSDLNIIINNKIEDL